MPQKIAVLGPESTGKSALTLALATHFNAPFVPEMAREYLTEIGTAYKYQDVLNIAALQHKTEQTLLQNNRNASFLFCDTEWITIKIWLEYKNWAVPDWMIEQIKNADYSLYLLTAIDLPWQEDPLRENPNDRQELFQLFEKELHFFSKKYKIVRGKDEERLKNAISFL